MIPQYSNIDVQNIKIQQNIKIPKYQNSNIPVKTVKESVDAFADFPCTNINSSLNLCFRLALNLQT